MRLISDEDLKDRASEYCLSEDEFRRFCEIIDAEPTVYDIDKVVKQLEESKIKLIDNKTILTDAHQEYNAGLSRAIEIVKQDRIPIGIHTYSDSYLGNLKKSELIKRYRELEIEIFNVILKSNIRTEKLLEEKERIKQWTHMKR